MTNATSADTADAVAWDRFARRGEFARAWEISDRIRRRSAPTHDPAVPRHFQRIWDGTPFNDRCVLIRCYHGLGDTIQFIRYAPLVHALASRVIVWAQPALLPLLHSMEGIDQLIALHDGAPDVAYDVDVEIMELPYAFRTTLATLPSRVPYLASSPAGIGIPRPRVGVVWRAGDWNEQRSIPFPTIARLFDDDRIGWCSLQFAPQPHEHHPSLRQVDTRGVMNMAAAVAAVDLLLTVDSMPAHLAGAMAVPVWTLLPSPCDWRWMEERDDSPWYPTMRLFRQHDGGWPEVIERVAAALTATAAGERPVQSRSAAR